MRLSLIYEGFNLDVKKITLERATSLTQPQDIRDIGDWLGKDPTQIDWFWGSEPIENFASQISEMESTYDEFPKDKVRTEKIFALLKSGAKPMPIFVKFGDEKKFIMEGRHRIVAFSWFAMKAVPVIYPH